MATKKYSFLDIEKISYRNFLLVPLRKQDIQSIRIWRNDQIDFLRQKKILSIKEQRSYYEKIINPSFFSKQPDLILFSFLHNNTCLGYGGLVHIDWDSKKAEVSFVNVTKRSKIKKLYQNDFNVFLKLIFKIAFNQMNLTKITTEMYDLRPWTLETLEKNGFKLEGRLKKHITIKNELFDVLLHAKFNL